MFPELVTRLSLAARPTEWANELLELRKKVGSITREKYMRDRSRHSIESSVDLLANDYGTRPVSDVVPPLM